MNQVYSISVKQSVVGLLAAGLDHLKDNRFIPHEVMPFMNTILTLEQRNLAMNVFIRDFYCKLKKKDINPILVKGQGIALCYDKPLWRASGDIDLLLDPIGFEKAVPIVTLMSDSFGEIRHKTKHLAMTFGPWEVELHGTLRSQLGRRVDKVLDEVQRDTFDKRNIRIWHNGDAVISLPEPNNDVFFVFTHILQHFFRGGIGLRQLCDWCRLLWTFKNSLNINLLESRLRSAGLMTEWKAFAYLAVNDLGLEEKAIPFYSSSLSWQWRSKKILSYILQTGNMGHNRDNSYISRYPYIVYKLISFFRYTCDSLRLCLIFPKDSVRVWFLRVKDSFLAVSKGK